MTIEPKNECPPVHILVVDDEPDHLSLMINLLMPKYHTTGADTAQRAIELCQQRAFHLGILDVRLPDLPGHELVLRLRSMNCRMAFVLVTAHADVANVIHAFRDCEVSDYIPKPFHAHEFLDCVDRTVDSTNASACLVLSDLVICLQSRCVSQGKDLISLSEQEFDLLVYLAQNAHRVVTPAELWRVRGCKDEDPANEVLWSAVKRLRAKLGDNRNSPRYIRTVRGRGYQAVQSVELCANV